MYGTNPMGIQPGFFQLEDSKLRQIQIVSICFHDLAFETSLDE